MEKGKKTVKIVSHKRSSEFGKPTKIPSASARSQRSDDEIEFQISDASPQYSSTSFLTTLEDESEQQENNLRPQILDVLGEYFDELDDDEFLSEVNEVLDTFKHLNLENKILEMFLNNNEPSLLATLPKARAMIQDLQETAPLLPDFFNAHFLL